MKADLLIVRYGEIGLKADYTRKSFENILVNNIKNSLKKENIDFRIEKTRGRIFLHTKKIEKTISILQKIFGIKSISPCFKTDSKINSLKKFILDVTKDRINSDTSFALKVRREGSHDYDSRDVAIVLGDEVVKKTKAKVNLSNPDVAVYIEIRNKDAFFFFEKYLGPGGLPLGSQGKVLSLIDSNESFLSTWYMMKRGCNPIFLLVNEKLKDALENFGEKWYFKPKIIDFDGNYNSIESISLQNSYYAIVTGYNMQNFSNIQKFSNFLSLPILPPLISMDKKEIKNKILELGLF